MRDYKRIKNKQLDKEIKDKQNQIAALNKRVEVSTVALKFKEELERELKM